MIRIITLNEGWGAGFPLGLLGAIFILAFLWSYWVWQVWTLERSNFLQNLKGVGHWSRQSCTRFHVLRQGNLHCMLNKSLRDRMKDSLGTPHVASSLAVPWRSRPEEGKGQTGTERSQPARLPLPPNLPSPAEAVRLCKQHAWSWCPGASGWDRQRTLAQRSNGPGSELCFCPFPGVGYEDWPSPSGSHAAPLNYLKHVSIWHTA